MSQPRTLNAAVAAITRQALGRRRSQLASVLSDWPMIAGPELAAKAVPQRLRSGRSDAGAELTLRVDPADALELQHESPRLMDRLNAHFGFRAIARITLVQGRIRRPPAALPPRALTAEEEGDVAALLRPVDRPALRQRLDALSRAVLGRRRWSE